MIQFGKPSLESNNSIINTASFQIIIKRVMMMMMINVSPPS